MYTLLPTFALSLFLFYSVYAMTAYGRTRASLAFLSMTVLICLWQGIWVSLFQTQDTGTAQVPTELGWIAILIMPTTLYRFAVEVVETPGKRHWLLAAYALDVTLVGLLLTTNLIIDGVYQLRFGLCPKADALEAVYVAQTAVLASRGIQVPYHRQQHATAEKRKWLLTFLFGVGLTSLAAAGYVVNYGVTFYLPDVLPPAVAPSIIAVGVVKFGLMHPYALAATIAHKARTLLTTIRLQTTEITHTWSDMYRGYLLVIDNGLCQPPRHLAVLDHLSKLARVITSEVVSAYSVIEMALISVMLGRLGRHTFVVRSLRECVETAVVQYSLQAGEHERVHVQTFSVD